VLLLLPPLLLHQALLVPAPDDDTAAGDHAACCDKLFGTHAGPAAASQGPMALPCHSLLERADVSRWLPRGLWEDVAL